MKVDLYDFANKKVGDTEVPEEIFGAPWKPRLVKQVVLALQANRRRPWARVKTRAEVRGGGRKPWRQKGTGRARHGSIRSPLWAGGGKTHGPEESRDYSQKINKKMRRLALASVLSKKMEDGEGRVINSLTALPKTKQLAEKLRTFFGSSKRSPIASTLLVPNEENKDLFRAAANLPAVRALHPGSLNAEELLTYKHILIDQRAVPLIRRHYAIRKP